MAQRKRPEELRSYKWFGVKDLRSFGHRSRALQMGYTREDFSGKPVIALARGGALETVPSFGGVFFDDPSEASLEAAIARFEEMEPGILPAELQVWARRYSEAEFTRKISDLLDPVGQAFPPAHLRR